MQNWIGVDLDGTLAHYEHWQGEEHIGEAIPNMVKLVRDYVDNGYEVRIFTARLANCPDPDKTTSLIQDWLNTNGLPRLAVTCVKDHGLLLLYDDRAVPVIKNKGIVETQPVF